MIDGGERGKGLVRLASAAQDPSDGPTANQVHLLNLIIRIILFELSTIKLATTVTGFPSRQKSSVSRRLYNNP